MFKSVSVCVCVGEIDAHYIHVETEIGAQTHKEKKRLSEKVRSILRQGSASNLHLRDAPALGLCSLFQQSASKTMKSPQGHLHYLGQRAE